MEAAEHECIRESLNVTAINIQVRANGKLLLTGEYFVLDGATALAIPTQLGQRMQVKESSGSEIIWKSYDHLGQIWFEGKFDLMGFDIIQSSDPEIAERLRSVLRAACNLNSEFCSHWKKYRVETYLEFDRNWGLGSSSTLIYCIAMWADVNPYHLLFNSLGGSGYDIACADAEGPILYQLGEDELNIKHVDFMPAFSSKLFFVHLGAKSDTREAINDYYAKKPHLNGSLHEISDLSKRIADTGSFDDFEKLLALHEEIVSKVLKEPTIKSSRFPDFWGTVKSLGAWGGDFALVTSDRPADVTRSYFQDKGYSEVFPYTKLVLS